MKTTIVNQYFDRVGGKLVPQPHKSFFKEIVKTREDKFLEDAANGAQSSTLIP